MKEIIERTLKDTVMCSTSVATVMLLRCITMILYDMWKKNYDTKPKGKNKC